MKRRFRLSPQAFLDVREIWQFIADDNIEAADRVRDEIFEAFAGLAKHPGKGHRRQDVTDQSVLFWPVRSYLVIYRATKPLEIVRVVHGARDVSGLL